MSSAYQTNRALGMRGRTMQRPAVFNGGAERRAGRSELGDILPPIATVVHGSATSIAIPAGTSIGANLCGWYPLIDIAVKDFGEDLLLFGWSCTLLSTNPTPTTPATQAAWGNTRGERAAIVFGDGELPIASGGVWNGAPCNLAGVCAGISLDASERPRYLGYQLFPIGSYTDAIPFKWSVPFLASPFVRRLTSDRRLQAALVIDGTQLTTGANKSWVGSVAVSMHIGFTQHPVAFRR